MAGTIEFYRILYYHKMLTLKDLIDSYTIAIQFQAIIRQQGPNDDRSTRLTVRRPLSLV